MIRILFVCSGNICRSPTAEGVFRHLVARAGLEARIDVDSAGTHGFHVGEAPDERACAAAGRRGVDLSDQRARRVRREDFDAFDLILAMDRGHHRQLVAMAPDGAADKIAMFLDFAPDLGAGEVPDPYYGGGAGFELVLDLIETGAAGLLEHVKTTHLSPAR